MAEIKIIRKPVKLNGNITPNQVKRKYSTINTKIAKLNEQLVELRTLCSHPDLTKKYGGNTGNYDPSADSYWIDWACPDCGKRWSTDQDRENLLKPGVVIK